MLDAPEERTECVCEYDWTDGGAICQECKKPRGTCAEPSEGRKESEPDEDEINCILERADEPSNYDGDEAQEWIIQECVFPDLKKLADAYRRAKTISRSQLEAAAEALWKKRLSPNPWQNIATSTKEVMRNDARAAFHAIGMNVEGKP